nr:hypothetical protein [Tanacetum cinerariifolium]
MSKNAKPPKGSKSKDSTSSSSKGTKSQPKSSAKSMQAEEPVFEVADTEISQDQRVDLGHEYLFDLSKPLPLIEAQDHQVVPANYFFNNDLEYLKGGSSSKKYTTSTTKTKAAKYGNIEGIKDMLGVKSYQKKLNIIKLKTYKFNISNLTPYTAYNNPQGIICLDKLKRNGFIHSDELYKFCDGTLTSVRTVLHDIANNLRMEYLTKRRWSNLDRKRSRIMIKAIDQQLFKRRLIRNLEKSFRGREHENDFRLLKQII